jgi:hypothetical protein
MVTRGTLKLKRRARQTECRKRRFLGNKRLPAELTENTDSMGCVAGYRPPRHGPLGSCQKIAHRSRRSSAAGFTLVKPVDIEKIQRLLANDDARTQAP